MQAFFAFCWREWNIQFYLLIPFYLVVTKNILVALHITLKRVFDIYMLSTWKISEFNGTRNTMKQKLKERIKSES